MTDSWIETTLEESAEVLMGQSPPGHSYNIGGVGLPFLQGSAEFGEHTPVPVKWCSQPTKIAEVGDLMVSVRAPVGDTNFANQRLAIGRGLAIVRGGDTALTEYLRLVIQSETASLLATSGSGMFSSITAANLRAFKFSLPPVHVQRRIVDLMSHLDYHLENLRTERDAAGFTLGSLRSSFMKTSSDWNCAPLSDVAEVRLGRMLSKERANGKDLAPYIRNANVQWNGLSLEDLKTMSFPARERATYALRAGDILVCEGGDPGRAVILHSDLPGIFYQKAIHRLRVSSESVLPGYLYHWLAECYADERIGDLCTNTTIKHLTAEKFRTLLVHWPSIEQQTEITRTLDDARTLVERFTDEVEALEQVRSKTLSVLLAGTHTTPDSYDALLSEVA